MGRHELAGAMSNLAEARDPPSLGREPVHTRVAIAVGDIDLAVCGDGGAGRMVERLGPAGLVAFAEPEDRRAAHVEDDDLVRVAVDDPGAVLRVDGNPVRIEDQALAIGAKKGAAGSEDEHWRIAPPQHMDMAPGIDRNLAHPRRRHAGRKAAEVALDVIAPARERNAPLHHVTHAPDSRRASRRGLTKPSARAGGNCRSLP